MFNRPFMGGMERKGVIASGTPAVYSCGGARGPESAPDRFILGADCTVPADTPWENLKVAIKAAHELPPVTLVAAEARAPITPESEQAPATQPGLRRTGDNPRIPPPGRIRKRSCSQRFEQGWPSGSSPEAAS